MAAKSAELAQQYGTQALEESSRKLEDTINKVQTNAEVEKTVGEVTQQAKGLFGSAGDFLFGELGSPGVEIIAWRSGSIPIKGALHTEI